MSTASIPASLQGVLWSTDISRLDLVRDRTYIIHQTLSSGRFEDIIWLFKTYPKKVIVDIFRAPYKAYRPSRFNFVKTILLRETTPLNEANYVINTPRDLRP